MARVTIDDTAVKQLQRDLAQSYWQRYRQIIGERFAAEAPIITGGLRSSRTVDPPVMRAGLWTISIRFRWVGLDRRPFAWLVYVGRRAQTRVRRIRSRRRTTYRIETVSHGMRSNHWIERAFRKEGFRNVRDLSPPN